MLYIHHFFCAEVELYRRVYFFVKLYKHEEKPPTNKIAHQMFSSILGTNIYIFCQTKGEMKTPKHIKKSLTCQAGQD